ncbi:hypothetical protein ACHAP8_012534 [Fusarium lateritium]
MTASLHSITGDWQPSSSTNTIFYELGDNTGRLHVYDGSDPKPLIWDAASGSTVPFTCPLQSQINFIVWITFEESAPDGLYMACNNYGLINKESYVSIFKNDRKLVGFPFSTGFQYASGQTPWCFNDELRFNVHSPAAGWSTASGTAQLEVYAIYPIQPQFFLKEGIPIDLLRLFIPNVTTGSIAKLQTEQDWISWVTNVCHGRQDPKAVPGQLRPNSTQHWLRYNVWDGQFSFIDQSGGLFSLMGWLNTYKDHQNDSTKTLRLVNCFDQAAIVETALSLGLSNTRLHWEVVAPFGYINEDLTGWGTTNSPFFEGDKQNIQFKNVADPMRTPFRSHVFITVSATDNYVQSASMVVDACAGPVAGDLTYTEYLQDKALQNGIQLLLNGRQVDPKIWDGVTSTMGEQEGNTLNYKLEHYHGDTTVSVPTVVSNLSTAFAGSPSVSNAFNAQNVINAILDPILSNTDKSSGIVLDPQSDIDTILNDSTILPVASTTRVSVAGQVVGDTPAFISFQISVFSGGLADAVGGLKTRFAAFTLPTKWEKESLINFKEKQTQAMGDSRATIFGTYHLDLFLYKNIVVEIAGNSNPTSEALPGWTKALWAELTKY